MPPSVVVVAVEEAVIFPLIVSAPPTVEEARERKPLSKEAREATESEEEALREPATLSWLLIVEDASEITPPSSVVRPVARSVPPTAAEEEAERAPTTWRLLSIVEEAEETKPAILPLPSMLKRVVEALSWIKKGVPA